MSDLNVKVGFIGKLDMLKFKNMSKTREKAIQAAPASEISGVFPVNENAKKYCICQRSQDGRDRADQKACWQSVKGRKL